MYKSIESNPLASNKGSKQQKLLFRVSLIGYLCFSAFYTVSQQPESVTRTRSADTVFSTTTYLYDTLNRLTDITNSNGSGGLVSKYHYGLRLDGKRQSVTESGPATNGGMTVYTYDDQGKLTEENGPYADIKYGYDNVGNRLTRTVTNAATGNSTTLVNGATVNTYDLSDRAATVNGSATDTCDLDGNETTGRFRRQLHKQDWSSNFYGYHQNRPAGAVWGFDLRLRRHTCRYHAGPFHGLGGRAPGGRWGHLRKAVL